MATTPRSKRASTAKDDPPQGQAVPRVQTLEDALVQLRRPFTANAVKFKLQTNPKDITKNAVVVTYIDARLAAARLNAVPGLLWEETYDAVPGVQQGQGVRPSMLCALTLRVGDEKVTHQDVGTSGSWGEETGIKGLPSDAFKRAAVKAGVGASIYAAPKRYIKGSDLGGYEKRNGDRVYQLTAANERQLRTLYQQWLDDVAIKEFGTPLDHGDTEDAQGDVEAHAQDAPQLDDHEPFPYGDAASPQLTTSATRALAFLLNTGDGPNDDLAAKVMEQVQADTAGDGQQPYLPRIVARAFAHTAKALKDNLPAEPADDNPAPDAGKEQ